MNSPVFRLADLAFRLMYEDDLPHVMTIERAAYDHPWRAGIFRDCLRAGYCCWLLEHLHSGIVAHGVMSVAVGEAQLLNLCVAPAWQRHGVGYAMLEHLIHVARHYGAGMMFLEVRASNLAARRLYERLGFNEVGLRRNYYPATQGREDALILALDLGKAQHF